jgi:hypothetical protein
MASIRFATLGRSGQSRKNWIGILPAVGARTRPRAVGPYGITGTPKGDIWFVSLAGPAVPGFSYSDATRGKGARIRLGRRHPGPLYRRPASVVVCTSMARDRFATISSAPLFICALGLV